MPTLIPSFYPSFRCDPSRCQHSCCVDWEIGIDEESLCNYHARTDALAKEIVSHIAPSPDPHFTLTEGERCPFLQKDGLCALIVREGERILPEICREHPRFRNFYGEDFVELSLGLSCEIAAAKLLEEKSLHFLFSPLEIDSLMTEYPTELFDLDSMKLPNEDGEFLREKYRILFSILEGDNLTELTDTNEYQKHARQALKALPSLESLSVDFATLFDEKEVDAYLFEGEASSLLSENEKANLLAMTVFRHASTESFYSLPTVLDFSRFFVSLIDYLVTVQHYDKVESVRILSSEIEYSEENTDRLLDVFEGIDG